MKWLKKWIHRNRDKQKYHDKYEKNDVTRLFEDLEAAYVKKVRIKNHYENLEQTSKVLEAYAKLDTNEIEKLSKWAGEYKSILDRKQLLQGRLIKNNRALYKLAEYEESLPELIAELRVVETKVRESERDIFYLEEEKEELREDREHLIRGYRFLRKFSVFFCIVIALATMGLFGLMQMLMSEIWLYISGFSMILVLFLASFVGMKTKIEKELRINELLQQKAVRYINKSKIRYFHHIRYLEFQFDKLEVDSVAKLEMQYNRYIKNKHNQLEYSRYNEQLMKIEDQIQELFKVKEIYIEGFEEMEEWLLAPKKAEKLRNIRQEQKKSLEQIKNIETYEEGLLQEIKVLGEQPEYQYLIPEKMQDYKQLTNTHLDKQVQCA